MRRSDRALNPDQCQKLLAAANVCRLALVDPEQGIPYIVPLTYGWEPDRLVFHAALEGRKLDLIRSQGRAAFEIDLHSGIIDAQKACDWTVKFASVIGTGRVRILDEERDKSLALERLMRHNGYSGPLEMPPAAVRGTAVFELRIGQMSGKCNDLAWFEQAVVERSDSP
ncbi:MAG: pyridoxamine 5'-phosphate oxidase family protein [Geothermobacteraceae bacterium]